VRGFKLRAGVNRKKANNKNEKNKKSVRRE